MEYRSADIKIQELKDEYRRLEKEQEGYSEILDEIIYIDCEIESEQSTIGIRVQESHRRATECHST